VSLNDTVYFVKSKYGEEALQLAVSLMREEYKPLYNKVILSDQ
jgi:hypothetical protein